MEEIRSLIHTMRDCSQQDKDEQFCTAASALRDILSKDDTLCCSDGVAQAISPDIVQLVLAKLDGNDTLTYLSTLLYLTRGKYPSIGKGVCSHLISMILPSSGKSLDVREAAVACLTRGPMHTRPLDGMEAFTAVRDMLLTTTISFSYFANLVSCPEGKKAIASESLVMELLLKRYVEHGYQSAGHAISGIISVAHNKEVCEAELSTCLLKLLMEATDDGAIRCLSKLKELTAICSKCGLHAIKNAKVIENLSTFVERKSQRVKLAVAKCVAFGLLTFEETLDDAMVLCTATSLHETMVEMLGSDDKATCTGVADSYFWNFSCSPEGCSILGREKRVMNSLTKILVDYGIGLADGAIYNMVGFSEADRAIVKHLREARVIEHILEKLAMQIDDSLKKKYLVLLGRIMSHTPVAIKELKLVEKLLALSVRSSQQVQIAVIECVTHGSLDYEDTMISSVSSGFHSHVQALLTSIVKEVADVAAVYFKQASEGIAGKRVIAQDDDLVRLLVRQAKDGYRIAADIIYNILATSQYCAVFEGEIVQLGVVEHFLAKLEQCKDSSDTAATTHALSRLTRVINSVNLSSLALKCGFEATVFPLLQRDSKEVLRAVASAIGTLVEKASKEMVQHVFDSLFAEMRTRYLSNDVGQSDIATTIICAICKVYRRAVDTILEDSEWLRAIIKCFVKFYTGNYANFTLFRELFLSESIQSDFRDYQGQGPISLLCDEFQNYNDTTASDKPNRCRMKESLLQLLFDLLASPQASKRSRAYTVIGLLHSDNKNKLETIDTALFEGNKEQKNMALGYIITLTDCCESAQLCFLSRPQIVSKILQSDNSTAVWNISQHPDAKLHIPIQEFTERYNEIQSENSSDRDKFHWACAYSTICDPDAAGTIELTQSFAEKLWWELHNSLEVSSPHQSMYETLVPIANLSVSEKNKILLGDIGMVELMVKILHVSENVSGRLADRLAYSKTIAAQILLSLVFNEANKARLVNGSGLEILKNMATNVSLDAKLLENLQGVLFKVEHALPVGHVEDSFQDTQPHLMISYNWGSQPTVLKLAETLKAAGFNIWLDVEQMHGSTLETMAEAVENSACVLICMSEKYKDSPNCRLEGEYTNKCKKPFIPLMMQSNFNPKGWLGILLGSKLWFPFFDETDWGNKIKSLLKELTSAGIVPQSPTPPRKSAPSKDVPTVTLPSPPPTLPSSPPTTTVPSTTIPKPLPSQLGSVANWTNAEVGLWLERINLHSLKPVFQKHDVQGASLVTLHRMVTSEKSRSEKLAHATMEKMGVGIGDMLALFYHLTNIVNA